MAGDGQMSPGDTNLRKSLLQAVLLADLSAARRIIGQVETVYTWDQVLGNLLEPVLEEVGKGWEQSKLSLAQGYVAAKVAGELLERINAHHPPADAPEGGVARIAVVGNIEDDFHALGRRMVVTFLQSAGWRVTDLGNDVPAAQFVQCALECKAHVIGVSAMTYTTAANVQQVRAAIDASPLNGQVRLAVGGAIFNMRPDLVQEVGGDGTARNALAAPALFEQLRNSLPEADR
jgi:methanogenic corrinoid protein MtbC1